MDKKEMISALISNESNNADDIENNALFQAFINPIRNPIGYASMRSAFSVRPLCKDCLMEFDSEEHYSAHTLEECTIHKVHSS